MALAQLYRVIQDLEGNVVTGVLGTVTLSGTSTLASLFADAEGTLPLPNPTTNNAQYGSFSLFVAAGTYTMQFVKAGFTFETQSHITMRDPAAGVLSLTGTANRILVSPVGGVGDVTLSTPQDIALDSSVQFGRLGINTPAPGGAVHFTVADQASFAGPVGVGVAPSATHILSVNGQAQFFGGDFHQTGGAFLSGPVGIGTAPGAGFALAVNGVTQFSGGDMTHTDAMTAAFLNATSGGEMVMTHAALGGAIVSNQILTLRYNKGVNFGLVISPTGADAGASSPVVFNNVAGAQVGSIGTTATATSFNTSSDARLKEAVATLADALETVGRLRPVAFRWRVDGSLGHGFLADEVQQVVPEAVSGTPEAVDQTGQIIPMQMDTSKLVPWVIGAMQELVQRLEALEVRLA